MKYIKINKDKLKSEEINKVETRIKILMINSKNEMLVGYSYNCYQFIGGHLEKNEDLLDCLKREVKEETGIEIDVCDVSPFLLKEEFYKDYPKKGDNYNSRIYYFVIYTDSCPNINNTNYTEEELIGNFCYKYIDIDNFEKIIVDNYTKYENAKIIGLEMLVVFREYKNINDFT